MHCKKESSMVTGEDVYPHREDLYLLNFYKCHDCDAYVGCHKKNNRLGLTGIEPLGRPANNKLRSIRWFVHDCLDKHWKESENRREKRNMVYSKLSQEMDISEEECHVGLFSITKCRKALKVIKCW